MENKKTYRIGTLAIVIFLTIAIVFDLFTLIPLVGDFLGWIFWFGASVYLWKSGHGLANWKILTPEIISITGELIPGIQELPTIIASSLIIIIMSRIEDRTGFSLLPKTTKKLPGTTPPRLNKPRFNRQEGIRYPNQN